MAGETHKITRKTERIPVQNTFESLYSPLLKDVFTEQARQQIVQGAEAWPAARMYAELGQPDFSLAFVLLGQQLYEEKRQVFAQADERRGGLFERKGTGHN